MKKNYSGFTLIEIVIFIVVTAVIVGTILRAGGTGLLSAADTENQVTANLLAQQCMEWMLGNRRLNGYTTYTCPSTPGGTLCASVTGFTVSNSVVCTTLGADSNFKTLVVTVTGDGDATLRTLIANY
jgi:Tfp pilus assembly protein PilV